MVSFIRDAKNLGGRSQNFTWEVVTRKLTYFNLNLNLFREIKGSGAEHKI